jgi:hypothetical protein
MLMTKASVSNPTSIAQLSRRVMASPGKPAMAERSARPPPPHPAAQPPQAPRARFQGTFLLRQAIPLRRRLVPRLITL